MQALYQAEIRKEDMAIIVADFLKTEPDYPEYTREWASLLATETWKQREAFDVIVQRYSIGWDLDRINLVDRSLLRLALYEIIHTQTPHSVIINEIIELSKQFSTDESPKFINGILGSFVKKECSPELSSQLDESPV